MSGNLNISTSLYPSIYLLPSQNGTTNRTVFEGSYLGASSFSSWEDGTGNNRRMLEVRNAAYQASLDYAVMLMPLYLSGRQKADLAMALSIGDGYYIGETCLTPQMAYLNARLLARPTAGWLREQL